MYIHQFTMQLTTILTLVAAVAAVPTPMEKREVRRFALNAKVDGHPLNDAQIKKVDSHPHVFSVGGDEGQWELLTLNLDDAHLIDSSDTAIHIIPETGEFGNIGSWGQDPSGPFDIVNDDLCYQGNCDWEACPTPDGRYSLIHSSGNCDGSTQIKLRATYVVS